MSQVEIILGPTNTGKTFYAFEQMFSYHSGVFGFPLRLLARENYDKACNLYPINQIALITGEEKIIPKDAKYFFCTVESMPEDFFEFVCVDEIQLAADYERGHIFTQRILFSRGEQKTIFLGLIPALIAFINSPNETTSAPRLNFLISLSILMLEFAFTA